MERHKSIPRCDFFLCSLQCGCKDAVWCVLPTADSYRFSMCRVRDDAGGVLCSDGAVCQRDAAQSGGACMGHIFVLVFLEQIYTRHASKKHIPVAGDCVCRHACSVSVPHD